MIMPAVPFRLALVGCILAAGAAPAQPRLDRFGDPLPPGALYRIGTARLQLGAPLGKIAVSADGKRITACDYRSFAVWELDRGREVLRISDADYPSVYPLAFAPAGRAIVSTHRADDSDNVIVDLSLIAVDSHRRIHTLGQDPYSVVEGPDGKTLIALHQTRDADRFTLRHWDLTSGKALKEIDLRFHRTRRGGHPVAGLRLSQDGRLLAVLETDQAGQRTVRLYDTATGTERRRWAVAVDVDDFVFSPDGRFLTAASEDAHVWEVPTGKECGRWKLAHFNGFGREMAFAHDGESLLCRETADLVRRDRRTGQRLKEYPVTSGPVALMPDGRTAAVQGAEGAIRLLDLETGKDVLPMPRPGSQVAFSPDGRLIAWAEVDTLVLAEAATGKERRRWPAFAGGPIPLRVDEGYIHGRAEIVLAFSPDGKLLASGAGKSIRLWKVPSGQEVGTFEIKKDVWQLSFAADAQTLLVHDGESISLGDVGTSRLRTVPPESAIAPDGRTIAMIEAKGQRIVLRDVASNRVLRQLTADPVPIRWSNPLFSPDGRRLLAFGDAGRDRRSILQFWDAGTGKQLPSHVEDDLWIPDYIIGFSADSRMVAVERTDERIGVLHTDTGKLLRTLGQTPDASGTRRTFGPTARRAFTPDGRTLVTSGENRVQFWDLATGGEICSHDAHRDFVREVVLSPDGRTVATTSDDHTILVWDLAHLVTANQPAPLPPEALWTDLANPDAARGRRAVETLMARPAQAVALLRQRLSPAVPPDTRQLAGWIRDLGNDDYESRQRADAALTRLAELAGPALRQAMAPGTPVETRRRIERLLDRLDPAVPLTGEVLRAVRAVQVLEGIGDAEALRLLRELVQGAPGARLTEEAAAALQRLKQKA
jgi:WD40 repeat protein